ncbi:hypothetical protein H6G50_01330 [Oscillatoria sp. FACHB-1406]|nr:hypothetical protein [Oscillatoria sp. FACHB-1406]
MNREQAYQGCLEKVSWAACQLEVEITLEALAEIADLIVRPMMGPWRYFHTPEHIFEVGGTEDAIEVLAALFHDVVYVQVDRSINFNLSYYIAPFSKETEGQLEIRKAHELPPDPCFEMTANVFGFVPGQALNPFAGQNEFLSALVAAKALQPLLRPQHLLQIIACIEATIPFRSPREDGKTVSELLFARLKTANCELEEPLSEEELVETVKKAVRVANRDVISFAYPQAGDFLDNTWNLLPETNHHLMAPGSYTVRQYRIALQKMEGFLCFLNPDVVFRQFQGEPDEATYQSWRATARENIEVARIYLSCKLLSIALLECLSLRLGEDISLATLVGELPGPGSEMYHFESFLPAVPNPYQPKTTREREALKVLEKGRASTSAYDLKHSPLATFIVKSVGFKEAQRLCDRAKDFFKNQCSSEEFIAEFDPQLFQVAIDGTISLFESRKAALCGQQPSHPNWLTSDLLS